MHRRPHTHTDPIHSDVFFVSFSPGPAFVSRSLYHTHSVPDRHTKPQPQLTNKSLTPSLPLHLSKPVAPYPHDAHPPSQAPHRTPEGLSPPPGFHLLLYHFPINLFHPSPAWPLLPTGQRQLPCISSPPANSPTGRYCCRRPQYIWMFGPARRERVRE